MLFRARPHFIAVEAKTFYVSLRRLPHAGTMGTGQGMFDLDKTCRI